ncbi:winged helix-turn-helix domain-containing protein [Phytohabitans sp. ZYX-F-186]|uniref:Winged helix-turn-helix domain-containing protein n=1 Tax=Phytohabitans maris TaxID=3071409 RepID=A0ABU0ZBD1_9ACTN|nr:winged helix-turn-helix domain-containing protein [Phytohabitans sp. ZYX-F-186]MDQ7904348.1 winged helix-turn-helix domain-containing protein [Phytohabitans sp. ZYX-F-186]
MTSLEERVAALEEQVTALAARLDRSPPEAGEAVPRTRDVFWALEGLKRRVTGGAGAVLYAGVVAPAEGERYEWQYGAAAADLMAEDWSAAAGALSALAHPVRLRLLREVLGGRHAASELSEVEGLGTSGQLYHHLRQLVGAGWLRATGRGQYVVPAERVVPLLVTLTAATR